MKNDSIYELSTNVAVLPVTVATGNEHFDLEKMNIHDDKMQIPGSQWIP
jgi:hypothetical protein